MNTRRPRPGSRPRPSLRRQPEQGEGERLQKVLAQAGLGSRREMEELIRAGKITVNGKPAQLGMRITTADTVRISRRQIMLREPRDVPRVLVYHKPAGQIVSRDDPQGRNSVFEHLPPVKGARWVTVGRLDYNTEGLLIFTTSGELANRLMHPRYELQREYAVRLRGQVAPEQKAQLLGGIELEDGMATVDSIDDAGGRGVNHWYRVVLTEGRNREVRRLFEAIGLEVSRLIRVRFGPVALPPRLLRGRARDLDRTEVRELLVSAGLAAPAAPEKGRRAPRGANPAAAPAAARKRSRSRR